jgi:bifunctional non-homologous end joining protein LigD
MQTYPVTSGSKGLQLYAPISGRQDADVVRSYAHEMAKELEAASPRLVVSRMAKAVRGGKVFIDWSQNDDAKTTITPYSLRGLDRPFVAAPRTWDELEEPGSLRQLVAGDIPDRLEQLGDLSPPTGQDGPRLP